MIVNSFDEAKKIYTYARSKFESIRDAQADHIYRELISMLDLLIPRLNYLTFKVECRGIPGDLNGLNSLLNDAYRLRGDVWNRFLTVGSGNYKEDYLTSSAWQNKRRQVMCRDGFYMSLWCPGYRGAP